MIYKYLIVNTIMSTPDNFASFVYLGGEISSLGLSVLISVLIVDSSGSVLGSGLYRNIS